MNSMEMTHSLSPELPEVGPGKPWKSIEDFNAFAEELKGWVAESKELAMNESVETYDQVEPLIEKAAEKTLHHAALSDRKTRKYFDLRLTILKKELAKQNTTPSPVESTPSDMHDSLPQDTEENVPDISPVSTGEEESVLTPVVAEGVGEEGAPSARSLSERQRQVLEFSSRFRSAQANGVPRPSASPVPAPQEEKERPRGFDVLKDFVPASKAQSATPLGEPIARTETTLSTEDTPVGRDPENTIPEPASLPSLERESRKDYIVKRIEGGAGDDIPFQVLLAYRRVPAVEAYLNGGFADNVLSGKVDLSTFSIDDLNILATHENHEVQDRANAELIKRYEEVGRTQDSSTDLASDLHERAVVTSEPIETTPERPGRVPAVVLRAIEAINEGKGDTVPLELLRKNARYPEIKKWLVEHGHLKEDPVLESVPDTNGTPEVVSTTPETPTTPSESSLTTPEITPSSSEEAANAMALQVKESIEKGAFDLTLATSAQLEALLRHPDIGIQERAQKELTTRTRTRPSSDVLQTPEFETWVEKPKNAQLAEHLVDSLPSSASLPHEGSLVPESGPRETAPVSKDFVSETPVDPNGLIETLSNGTRIQDIDMIGRTMKRSPELRACVRASRLYSLDEKRVMAKRAKLDGVELEEFLSEEGDVSTESPLLADASDSANILVEEIPVEHIEVASVEGAEEPFGDADGAVAELPGAEMVVEDEQRTLASFVDRTPANDAWVDGPDVAPSSDPYWTAVAKQIEDHPAGDPQAPESHASDTHTPGDPYWAAVAKQTGELSSELSLVPREGEESDDPSLSGELTPASLLVEESTAPDAEMSSTEHTAEVGTEEHATETTPLISPHEQWGKLSAEEQRDFIEQCRFLFTPGHSYLVPSEGVKERASLVNFDEVNGEVILRGKSGNEQRVPVFAFYDLNTTSDSLVEEEADDVSPDDLAQKWVLTLAEQAHLTGVAGFAPGDVIAMPNGEQGWRLAGMNVGDARVRVLLLNAEGDQIMNERELTIEEFRAYNVVSSDADPVAPETTVQVAETKEERLATRELITGQFKETFGIDEKELMSIPEFAALSPGRQLLVHNELGNYALSQIKADALLAYREKMKALNIPLSAFERSLTQKKGLLGTLGNIAVGVAQFRHRNTWTKVGMSIFKRKMIAENEKEIAQGYAEGKFNAQEFIQSLSAQAKEGPEATIEHGAVKLSFLHEGLFEGMLTPQEREVVASFNDRAVEFSNIPHAWKEHSATPEEQERYREKEELYREKLDELLTVLNAHGDTTSALVDVNELDRKITFTQLFNAYPEAAEQLADIREQSSLWALVKDMAATRGAMFALGGSIRTSAALVASQVAVGGAALFAAPVAGAATGGYMGHKRAVSELSERELLAKRGVQDESAEALNVVIAGTRKSREGVERNGLIGKLEELIQEINVTSDDETDTTTLVRQAPNTDGTRGAVMAQGELGATLGTAHTLVESGRTITKNKKEELLRELDRRIAYTQVKLDKGLVNFGEKEDQIKNQYALLRALATAKALRAASKSTDANVAFDEKGDEYDNSWRTDKRSADERLNAILDLHEQKVSDAQKAYIRKTTKQAALYGSVFAFGGALVADVVHGMYVPGSSTTMNTIEALRGVKSSGGVVSPVAEVAPLGVPLPAANKEDIAMVLREGWKGGLLEKAQDVAFNANYVKGATELVGRTPGVGISDTELSALLATDGVPKLSGVHQELLSAMRASGGTRLPDEVVAGIMLKHHVPTSLGSIAPSAETVVAEVAPLHSVESGETLSSIMKAELPALRGLSASAKENVIQNFIHRATNDELHAVGVEDTERMLLSEGKTLDLAKLNELVLAKHVGTDSLVEHARKIFGSDPDATTVTPKIEAHDVPPQEIVSDTPHTTAPTETVVERKGPSPIEVAPSILDRERALALADTYLNSDMKNVTTGKPTPLGEVWADMSQYRAKDVMTLTQDELGDQQMWEKILILRQYATKQGFTAKNHLVPDDKESINQFFHRAHAERIVNDGVREGRPEVIDMPAKVNEPVPTLVKRSTPLDVPRETPKAVPPAPVQMAPSKGAGVSNPHLPPPNPTGSSRVFTPYRGPSTSSGAPASPEDGFTLPPTERRQFIPKQRY